MRDDEILETEISDQEEESSSEEVALTNETGEQRRRNKFCNELADKLQDIESDSIEFADSGFAIRERDIQEHFQQKYARQKSPLRELGKWLFALITLPLFAFGALGFLATTREVRQGELLVKRRKIGNCEYTVLPAGRHSLFSWEEYVGEPQSSNNNFLELGTETVVRVGPGEMGAVVHKATSDIILLEPGTYNFNNIEYDIEQPQNVSSNSGASTFVFGGTSGLGVVRVLGDEIAVLSNKLTGENMILKPGVYPYLNSDYIVYGPEKRNHDVVRLGAIEIITARAGFEGIYYHEQGGKDAAIDVIESGERKILDISKGERFHHLINTQVRSEEVEVEHAVTSDGFEFKVKANITYQVDDVKVAAQKIDNASESSDEQTDQIKEEVHQFARRIISEIILKHSRRDLQPFSAELVDSEQQAAEGEAASADSSEVKLKRIGSEIKEKLKSTLDEWGVSLHEDIEIIDLTMIDPEQRAQFNEKVNEIQNEIFKNEAERRKADRIQVENENLIATAEAKAKAEKVGQRVQIDALREALSDAGLSKDEIAEYLVKNQLYSMFENSRSVIPVPLDMHGFFKMGRTEEGEMYQVGNTTGNNSGTAVDSYLRTQTTAAQVALSDAMRQQQSATGVDDETRSSLSATH